MHGQVLRSWRKKKNTEGQIPDFCIIFNTTLIVFRRLCVRVHPCRHHQGKTKAPVQEPKAAAYPVHTHAHTESLGNSPSLILYFIKNSNCATRLTLTHVLHTWDWKSWVWRGQLATFGVTTIAQCCRMAALALSISYFEASAEERRWQNTTAAHKPRVGNMKPTSHFLTQILHRILGEIL